MIKVVLCSNYFFNKVNENTSSKEADKLVENISYLTDKGYIAPHEDVTIIPANKDKVRGLITYIQNGHQLSIYFTESIKLMKCKSTYNQLMRSIVEYVTPFYLISDKKNEIRHFERKIDTIGMKVFQEQMQKIRGGV